MGQYFIIANLDKREYIHPHELKRGAKLLEICKDPFIKNLMSFLLNRNSKRDSKYFSNNGKWINDRIVLIGDSEDYRFFKQIQEQFKNMSNEVYIEYIEFTKTQSRGDF